MVPQKTILSRALFAGMAGASLLATDFAIAQQETIVTVTGSSIKRIGAEEALPVTVISRADIERSGATTARELIQNLTSMQGFTTTSDSVNGGGGGTTTASLKTLGSGYTLVLLNGRRIAPFTTGSSVNLEQLPISVISRVEILTDGASALYGSDAIAGVINFITGSNQTNGGFDLKVVRPEGSGANEEQFSISKGWGNVEKDGFNVLFGFSATSQKGLKASQRSFSRSGIIDFEEKGTKYRFLQTSINGDPPNIYIDNDKLDGSDYDFAVYSPSIVDSGSCGSNPLSFRGVGSQSMQCRFDYAGAVDAIPPSQQRSLFLSGAYKVSENTRIFGEWLQSDVSMLATFAPPAQPLGMQPGSILWNKYVTPYADGLGVANPEYGLYYMRLADAGGRANDYSTQSRHVTVGLESRVKGFDVEGSYTMSKNDIKDTTAGGYVSRTLMNTLIAEGKFDPFKQGSASSIAAIAPAVLRVTGLTESTLNTLAFRASGEAFKLAGVQSLIGFGFDLSSQKYKDEPAPIFQGPNALQPNYSDFPVGSGQGAKPFDSSRDKYGVYGELFVPISKGLELTAATRFDSYDAIKNSRNFSPDGKVLSPEVQGNSDSKATWKAAFRYQPSPSMLFRGSIGTGFSAPSMSSVTKPLAEFGVIGVQRDCPVGSGDPLFAGCRTVPTQYKLQTGGNPFTGDAGLRPEKSQQMTFGVLLEPTNKISAGIDFWKVEIDDAITSITEDAAFSDFDRYRGLFSLTTEAATGRQILTFNQTPVNAATYGASGYDLSVSGRTTTAGATLTTRFSLSHLFNSYTDYGFGGGKQSSLGKIGQNAQVAFRNLTQLAFTLDKGPWSGTLTTRWKPGYVDQTYKAGDATVYLVKADGTTGAATAIERRVSNYTISDFQASYKWSESLTFTATVKNLFDVDPPLSIKTVGGNMNGFDPRYHDGVGRSYMLQVSSRF